MNSDSLISKITKNKLGGMTHVCHPYYSGGWDGGNHGSRPVKHHLSLQKTGHREAGSCHPSYTGSKNKRIVVQAGLGVNVRTYSLFKKIAKAKKKKSWGAW
jgi:ribosomal protein L31